jgi:hypothetical protein
MWGTKKTKWGNQNLIDTEKDTMNSGIEELSDAKFQVNAKKTFEIIHKSSDVIFPKKGEQLQIVTFKSFNAALFLQHLSTIEDIEEMYISAYSLNFESAEIISKLCTNQNVKCEILISNLRNQAYRKKEEMTKQMFIENPNIKLFFCSSHAKVISIKTKKGNFYTIQGSGNLSFNSRVEQYVIDNHEGVFQFTKRWFNEIRVFLQDKKELVCFNY